MDANKRQFERKSLVRSVNVLIDDDSHACDLVDISLGGARVTLAHPVEVGITVHLDLDIGGAYRADVMWRRGGAVGLRFTEPEDKIATLLMALAF